MSCSYSVMNNNSSTDSSSDSSDEDNSLTNYYNDVQDMSNYVVQNLMPELLKLLPTPHPRIHIERHREEGHAILVIQYFASKPTYTDKIFRHRFRMDRHVFLRLVAEAEQHDEYFQQRPDATGRFGLSTIQKCTGAMRMLAYGMAADVVDEYIKLSGSSARLSLEKFCDVVISRFGNHYLRRPNRSDMELLLRMGLERGFPGMLGSIDCKHWQWKNCPSAWRGQYHGRSGKASLVLEAVASHDLWIWHSFFGIPGSLNDINILHRSPVFDDVLNGVAPQVTFQVNNNQYNMGYYLTDGIYPKYATFINSIP